MMKRERVTSSKTFKIINNNSTSSQRGKKYEKLIVKIGNEEKLLM
jgi:hypothetical protein